MKLKITEEQMKDSRSCWLAALAQKGQALRAAPEEMKGDRKLCMAAVAQDKFALKFVSGDLKNDREILMACIERYRQEGHTDNENARIKKWMAEDGASAEAIKSAFEQ